MSILKFPGKTGINPNIAIASQAPRAFPHYGLVRSTIARSFATSAQRMFVLDDGAISNTTEIKTPPAEGRAVVRSDGNISLDLSEVKTPGDLNLTYTKIEDGAVTDVEATVTLAPADKGKGWGIGAYYKLETDDNDAVIVEPAEDTRVIHVSPGGFTKQQIADREPGLAGPSNVSAVWLVNNRSDTENEYYGQTPTMAVHQEVLSTYFNKLAEKKFVSVWVLYERGGEYTVKPSMPSKVGKSALHPILIGSYGSGPLPRTPGNAPQPSKTFGTYQVIQDMEYDLSMAIGDASFVIVDNMVNTGLDAQSYPIKAEGIGVRGRGITVRRFKSLDATPQNPVGTRWHQANNDRTSSFYYSYLDGVLVEKFYSDLAGWEVGYRADRDGTFPKSPEDRSHAIYQQSRNIDCTMRYLFVTRPSHSAVQLRSAGILEHVFAAGGNSGINPGNGEKDFEPVPGMPVDIGNFAYLRDCIQTKGGYKDFYDDIGTNGADGFLKELAGGIRNAGLGTTLDRLLVVHSGQGTPIQGPGDIGPVGAVTQPSETYAVVNATGAGSPKKGYTAYSDYKVYDWEPAYNADQNVDGLDSAVLNATTIEAYNDQKAGTTGSSFFDFCDRIRTLDDPWNELPEIFGFFQPAFGYPVQTRVNPQIVRFEPHASGRSPGNRADIRDDWSTGDLPGTVAGDGVDFGGYKVHWNLTPQNPLSTLTFGKDAELNILGGALKPTGALTLDPGGNAVTVKGGGKFQLSGYSGAEPLDLTVVEGRFTNVGIFDGQADIRVIGASEAILAYEGADFTLRSGRRLTIGGLAIAGFDGAAGGAATITFETGSTLAFRPGLRLPIGSLTGYKTGTTYKAWPRLDDVITAANGATARVLEFIQTTNTQGHAILDEITGAFINGDAITGQAAANAFYDLGEVRMLGNVAGSRTCRFGQLREFRSGVHGFQPPNVASQIILGGVLEIDLRGCPDAMTHDLIQADVVSGGFEDVVVLGLGARDATIAVSANAVTLTVSETGTGMVSVI